MANRSLQVLALNPYHGGSHQAFVENWVENSSHQWKLLTLPARHWKWRMRQASITFAEQLHQQNLNLHDYDLLFCTDMMNLAEFKGLVPEVSNCPSIIYFHENQFSYPKRTNSDRDQHFGFTNLISAYAADSVWFNSHFHKCEFLEAASNQVKIWPDELPRSFVEQIQQKSTVVYPGVKTITSSHGTNDPNRPLNILWAARWEHDKNFDDFLVAIRKLKQRTPSFTLSIIGQSFQEVPDVFLRAKQEFSAEILHWGFLDQEHYQRVLLEADIVVSTAQHEFFGIAVVEAISAGCYPLLPNRLSYPELINDDQRFLYDGSIDSLTDKLTNMITHFNSHKWIQDVNDSINYVMSFENSMRARELDDSLRKVFTNWQESL